MSQGLLFIKIINFALKLKFFDEVNTLWEHERVFNSERHQNYFKISN